MALVPKNITPAQNKPVVWTGRNIVNAYTLIAILYCLLSTLLFYTIGANRFLSAVHCLALVTIAINYLVLQRTGNYQRATNIILATGTVVVLSLFGTGGWENTGFLWPFAYLPFVVFLSSGKNSFYWAIALVAGCAILVVFHFTGFIISPYSPVVLANYFAALLIFLACLYFFRKTTLEAEQALLESERQVQTIFNSAPDAVIVIDQAGLIVQWNPKAETLFGWKANEIMNKLLSETIIPHRHRTAHQKGLEHFLHTGSGPVLNKTIEIHALTKDNREFDVALRISPTMVKDRYLFIGFLRDITDQKKADEKIKHLNATLEQRIADRTDELRKSEQKYRELFQNNPMPMWVIDLPSFRFLNVNDAAIRHYGYSREEFLRMTAIQIRPEEEKDAFVQLDRTVKTGAFYTGRWKHRKKNGSIITVEISADEITFEGKKARLILANDITDRLKTEETRALYAAIVNSTDDAILTKTMQGHITSWNPGAEMLFGYTSEETLGRHISLLTPPGRADEEESIMEKIRQGTTIHHYETERIRKDGNSIHVSLSVSPLKDAQGSIFGASNIGRNITERKIAEENLRRSLKEISDYKYALDESCIVAITDQKGIIKYVNDKFCKISKYTEQELLGHDHRIINSGYHPAEFIRRLWTTIAIGNIWRGEIKNKAKDGGYYWVDTTIVPFLNEQGKPYQYVAIRADITERKNAEHNIKELNETLEKKVTDRTVQLEAVNKELEAFTYSVSHDLRAPLRIIDGYANILVDDYAITLDKEGNRLLGIIMSNARRMGDLIDDLLNLSRLGRKDLSVQKINMQELVVPVISELLSMNGHHPEINTGSLEPADCDSSLIRQVWGNLISNAIKYSGTREKPSIEINSHKTTTEIIYSVKDNGVGFDMQYAHKLFGVFQRLHKITEFEGTGVGLALVQRIVEKHGGRVWAEGEPDKGAIFYFSLPVRNASGHLPKQMDYHV